MKKILLTVVTALFTLAMFGQGADKAFLDAWKARHNSDKQFSGFLMDFRDSSIYHEWTKNKEVEASPSNTYDVIWDATEKALKIHFLFLGSSTVKIKDNYSGAVSVGTRITKKKADTSATAPAFNPFMGVTGADSILCTNYINMSDSNNRSIAVYCKLVNCDDSATIRFDIFDVNGRKTNYDNSSCKRGIKPSVDFQRILFTWGYDSGNDLGNIGGWNESAVTFFDGYSGDFWGCKTGHWDATHATGLPGLVNGSGAYQVPLESAYMVPKFSFSTNGGALTDSWVKQMIAGTRDKDYSLLIQKIEFGVAPFSDAPVVGAIKAKKITPNTGTKFTFEGQGTMVDILGQTVATGNGVIDASQLSEGVYFIIIDGIASEVIVK